MTVSEDTLGQPVPPNTQHAVSVSLPTWRSNVGYEEGEDWVISRMTIGYPRFFVHKSIAAFADLIAQSHGTSNEAAILLPTHESATRCIQFFLAHGSHDAPKPRVLDFHTVPGAAVELASDVLSFSAALFDKSFAKLAKAFWQHTGEGVSSRRAEYCRQMYERGALVERRPEPENHRHSKGPKRYQKESIPDGLGKPKQVTEDREANPVNGHADAVDQAKFVEERYGRNLHLQLAEQAKLAIRRRIAGSLVVDSELETALAKPKDSQHMRDVAGFSEDDVYLYPGGMNSIYHTHRTLMAARGEKKSVCFGFPYVDTLKILEKFGPGCLFYGNGSSADLDDLEARLANGERYLALFCEFPSNPVLRTPDVQRIRRLADTYDFSVVIDETIGNFLNVHVLPYADVLVSSLTKIFSGDGNVMGGSAILNPLGRHYTLLKTAWSHHYTDTYWPEDALFMERNSRDFVARIRAINATAARICALLAASTKVKRVYYPSASDSRQNYDACRRGPDAGYGGLLSATFRSLDDAARFYDNLDTLKGPSLGTNFTLSSPFVILAHYTELEWAAQFGVEAALVRFSIGLEPIEELVAAFQRALDAV